MDWNWPQGGFDDSQNFWNLGEREMFFFTTHRRSYTHYHTHVCTHTRRLRKTGQAEFDEVTTGASLVTARCLPPEENPSKWDMQCQTWDLNLNGLRVQPPPLVTLTTRKVFKHKENSNKLAKTKKPRKTQRATREKELSFSRKNSCKIWNLWAITVS